MKFHEIFHSLQGTTVTSNRSKLIASNYYKNKAQSIDIARILSKTNTETTDKPLFTCFERMIKDLLLLKLNPNDED